MIKTRQSPAGGNVAVRRSSCRSRLIPARRVILWTGAIDALVAGVHGAPFDVLGPHRAYTDDGVRTFVRTFQPDAERVWLIPHLSEAASRSQRLSACR